MATLKDKIKEILVIKSIINNEVIAEKKIVSENDWENRIDGYFFAVLNNENKEKNILEFIREKRKNTEEEIAVMEEAEESLSAFQKWCIDKKYYKLISFFWANNEGLKRIKKYFCRKNYLNKKINRYKNIDENFDLKIVNDFNVEDLEFLVKGEKIDLEKDFGIYYVTKMISNQEEYDIHFSVEKREVIPKKIIMTEDNKVNVILAINRHSGEEDINELIELNRISYDGKVLGTKFKAFKYKEDLLVFLENIKNSLQISYESVIKSLKTE